MTLIHGTLAKTTGGIAQNPWTSGIRFLGINCDGDSTVQDWRHAIRKTVMKRQMTLRSTVVS